MDHLKNLLESFNLKVLCFSSIEEFIGYISFLKTNIVFVQESLALIHSFVQLKMFPLKNTPILKILLTKTKFDDSVFVYDSAENIYLKVVKNIKRNIKNNKIISIEKVKIKKNPFWRKLIP